MAESCGGGSNPVPAAGLGEALGEVLGRTMYVRGMVLYGKLELLQWKSLLVDIAQAMRMTPVASPGVWTYPTESHSGGTGNTVLQPITESFIALDTWPDHEGAYLFICSCKPFDFGPVEDEIIPSGITVGDSFSNNLRLGA